MRSYFFWATNYTGRIFWVVVGSSSYCQLFPFSSDHRGSRGDATEGARAGGGTEEAGSDPTTAVQVPAQWAEGGRGLTGWANGCVRPRQRSRHLTRSCLPKYGWLLYSHITMEYSTWNRPVWWAKQVPVPCSLFVYVRVAVCNVCVCFFSEWHWQSSIWRRLLL